MLFVEVSLLRFNIKLTAIILLFIMFFHLTGFAIMGAGAAKAAFWEEQKGNIFTLIKAFLMLWILNIMRDNLSGDNNTDLITTTIMNSINTGY